MISAISSRIKQKLLPNFTNGAECLEGTPTIVIYTAR